MNIKNILKDRRILADELFNMERALKLACQELDDSGVCNLHDTLKCSDDPKVSCSECLFDYFIEKARKYNDI